MGQSPGPYVLVRVEYSTQVSLNTCWDKTNIEYVGEKIRHDEMICQACIVESFFCNPQWGRIAAGRLKWMTSPMDSNRASFRIPIFLQNN